jgi:predicted nucleic acid-binding Zn ribbon protein
MYWRRCYEDLMRLISKEKMDREERRKRNVAAAVVGSILVFIVALVLRWLQVW